MEHTMKLRNRLLAAALPVFLGVPLTIAQEKTSEKLGKVHFPVSCGAEAQQRFDRAVALLHSFWFDAAIKGFGEVAQADQNCAMAYWGAAMASLGNPFAWPPAAKALKEGSAAVEKAKAIGAKSPRERDYISAIEVFYKDAETVDHRTRALAYEKGMEGIYRRYPEDEEAAVFYALALNATALPTDKKYGNQLKAAGILEKVFAKQPEHPGVAHYLIHSYDYPSIAGRGLSAARRYTTIAPSAPHALHMPSHIFTRRGLWEDSIKSNLASAAAAKNQFDQFHAMDYLAYAYLQGAQDVEAKKVLDELNSIQKITLEHFVTGYALAAIPARYAIERRRWEEAAAITPKPGDFPWNRFPQSESVVVFARALGAARSGNAAQSRQDLERLNALRESLAQARQGYWQEQVNIQSKVIEAWIAYAEGHRERALGVMRAAAYAEDATDKHPVTPGPLVPARELLAEMLLEANQPAQALKEFEASMRIEPGRFRGLYGAAKAAQLSGNRKKAENYYTKLLALCRHADTERQEMREAKAFLGKE
jgi:tetratricopeptide (TPR) repeat protein